MAANALETTRIRIGEQLYKLGGGRKWVEFFAVFTLLGLAHAYYLRGQAAGCTIVIDFSMLPSLLKFLFLSGAPVALVRWLDDDWSEPNTAIACLTAYLATDYFWVRQTGHPLCIYCEAMKLVPTFFAVFVAHKVGAKLSASPEPDLESV